MSQFGEGDRTGSRFACCLFFIYWLIIAGFLSKFRDNVEGRHLFWEEFVICCGFLTLGYKFS